MTFSNSLSLRGNFYSYVNFNPLSSSSTSFLFLFGKMVICLCHINPSPHLMYAPRSLPEMRSRTGKGEVINH